MSANSHISFSLLGSPVLKVDNRPVIKIKAAKSLALLYYLAVTGRPHSRLALGYLLWPNKCEEEARINLRQSLRLIRKAIPDAIYATRETIMLHPDCVVTVDAVEFEKILKNPFTTTIDQYRQAAALYEGDFLNGFSVSDAIPFEEWMTVKREHLHSLAVGLFSAILKNLPESNGPLLAIHYAYRLLQLEPWCETAHRMLMRTHATSGRYNAAIAQFETCRAILARELSLEPAPATLQLNEQILQQRVAF